MKYLNDKIVTIEPQILDLLILYVKTYWNLKIASLQSIILK